MRKLCLSIIFCFIFFISSGFTIKAGISYTVNEARQIAFENVQYKIDMSHYKNHFVDPNFEENLKALKKGKKKYKNRYINHFSNNTYGIMYKSNLYVVYYYTQKGKLFAIDIYNKKSYPKKAVKYSINGDLDGIILDLSSNEGYMFNAQKKLEAHWIGDNCYNEKGELIMTRK